MSLFEPAFHDACRGFTVRSNELTTDDRRADGLGGIDDFFDTWYTQCDVHRGDSSEVKSLESHLRAWFSYGLRTDGADSGT